MKTIVQYRIDEARRLIDAGDLDGLTKSDVNVRELIDGLEYLRRGVKDLAITHGVRGASGPAQPTIEETAKHIQRVMTEWVERANAYDAAVASVRDHCEGVLREASRQELECGKTGAHEALTESRTCRQILDLLKSAPKSWLRPGGVG